VNVRLLGPLEVRLEDGPIELGPRKQRAVLAMLALEPGRTISVDRLAEGLWGDEPPPSGAKMVQLYVSHLRRALDGDGAQIVTHGRGYELELRDGALDAAVAERLLDESRPREALALWRGEPLCDLADEPFAAAEIRKLDELRLRAAAMAIEDDLEAGRHDDVIGELDALVAAHPLRERLHAQRMLALYRAGRQSEALEAYSDARSALVGEIGVEPGAELRQLQEAILAQDPALDLPAPADEAPGMAPRPPPRRGPTRLLVGAAVLLLAGITAFGVIRVLGPEGLPRIDEDHIGLIDPDSGRITAQYTVGKGPGAVAAGADSVWVGNRVDGTVSRIDNDRQIVTIDVGGAPSGLAFGGGSLWVADAAAREVVQVDPGANNVVQRVTVGNAPRSLAVAGGGLWVASGVEGNVHRIDLTDGGALRTVPIGAIPTALVAGEGALWVASEESNTVSRLDARTGQVVRAIRVGNGPSALASGEGAVWVTNRHDGTVSRIDPTRNAVSAVIPIGGEPGALAVGGGSVWVARGTKGTVARVDPDRLAVAEEVPTGGSPAALALDHGDLWATAVASPSSHRGGTLRALSYGWGTFAIDPLDEWGYNPVTWQASSLAYDGLVAYRRVGGSAPGLVGALATDAPAPSRDGLTYRFTLRPDVHYSDGALVQPEDFRASIERVLRIGSASFPPMFSGIVGAPRCRPERCDLSRGIETDRSARTVTVHLTRPDGDFLHKLTTPFAFVVPADTPVRSTRNHPPPGTGPYRVAAWDDRHGGAFVRNPHFRSWSPEARPPGFADRIEVRQEKRDIQAQIADVDRGRADLVPVGDLFASHLSRRGLAALAARVPGQLTSGPQPTTEWMFLNVRMRPFDDPRVRRALNFATDRARIVELAGGPEVAVATCQIVPTAFPGHEPYCPYTDAPSKGGGWTGPDMERARALVQASGRAGERVIVRVPSFRRSFGRYFTGLLDDLGFRASLQVEGLDQYFARINDPRSRVQIGFAGYASDFESPSLILDTAFRCPTGDRDYEENHSRLCDRRLTRQFEGALASPVAESAEAWAAADRRITDLAAAVPLTNHRVVALVSKRAGNVQHHLQWSTLLDQMWVR
jgi:YVTN family beta-propeller protein